MQAIKRPRHRTGKTTPVHSVWDRRRCRMRHRKGRSVGTDRGPRSFFANARGEI